MSVRVRVVIHTALSLRTRSLAPLFVAMLAMGGGCSPSQQDPRNEFQTTLAIDADGAATVTRQLQAGSYLLEIRETDIDLRLLLDAPGVHTEYTDMVPRHGVLYAVVSLRAPGEARVTARSADHQ